MNNARVLVADDDPIFSAIATDNLASDKYEIVAVSDGAAAWDKLSRDQIDLAIIDLSMPRIDGFRLIALMRSTPYLRTTPIIVVTSCEDDSAVEEVGRQGISSYFKKPVDWPQLRRDIERLLQFDKDRGTFSRKSHSFDIGGTRSSSGRPLSFNLKR